MALLYRELPPPARELATLPARIAPWHPSAQENAPKFARIAPWHSSAQEWGIISGAEWEIVAACAGKRSLTRPERSVAPFCAGMGYHFRRGMKNCCRLRGKMPPNPPGMLCGTVLRGKMPPNPPGLLCGTVLRVNEVSFSARKEKL